jgi:broad specificity phosphatase PhoE
MWRSFIVLALWTPVFAAGQQPDEAVWSALRQNRNVVLIRHAITDPGIGDPPGFVPGKCETQRNLSVSGREDARRIGAAFRARNIPVAEVLSSRWCRCLDTARLAFGRATPAPMLDSIFSDSETAAQDKTRQVLTAMERRPASGNLVLVTHQQNILALTGVAAGAGEVVVAVPQGGKLRVIGRLTVPGGAGR